MEHVEHVGLKMLCMRALHERVHGQRINQVADNACTPGHEACGLPIIDTAAEDAKDFKVGWQHHRWRYALPIWHSAYSVSTVSTKTSQSCQRVVPPQRRGHNRTPLPSDGRMNRLLTGIHEEGALGMHCETNCAASSMRSPHHLYMSDVGLSASALHDTSE